MNSRYPLIRLPVIALLGIVIVGCSANRSTVQDIEQNAQADIVSSSQDNLRDGESVCKAIARELSVGDRQALNDRFDTRFVIARIESEIEINIYTKKDLRSFAHGLNAIMPGMSVVGEEQLRWDMLHGSGDGESYSCLVRTSLHEEGVSYVEFELRKVDGELRVVDWYDLLRESRISDLSVIFLRDINDMATAHLTAMPYQRNRVQQEQRRFLEFLKATKSGDPKRVLAAYDGLPPRFKQKPLYMLIALNMASMLDNGHYMRALRNLERRFGAENRYGMLLVDLYYEEKQYHKVDRVLRKFKQQVGEDPLLDLLLASLELEQGNMEAFYAYCLRIVDGNPNYLDTYWVLFDQFVADGKYPDAVLVLNVLKNMFEITLNKDVFVSEEKYRGFRKSAAFRAWRAGSS
ncbi:MAG: hypothetical protein AB2601_10365 [Candidatus Thiodiazotropha sp.]